MTLIYRLLIIVGTLTALFLFAGCGSSASLANGLPISITSNPAWGAGSEAASASTGSVSTGSVTLRTNARLYRVRDTILVKLSNQSNQTIFFPDHLTNCTVILLQRQAIAVRVGRGWQPVNPCRLGILTRLHALGAGQSLVVRLVAPFFGWPPGTYRAALSYHVSNNPGQVITIYSALFRVGPLVAEGL